MIDCHSTREFLYKRHFMKLELKVLKYLLEQYKWEEECEVGFNPIAIDALEEVIEYKESNT